MKIVYNKRIYYRDDSKYYSTPSAVHVMGVVELFGGAFFMYTAEYSNNSELRKWQSLRNMDDLVRFMHDNDTIF